MPFAPDLPVTSRVPAAVEAVHRFGFELLSHGAGAGVIFEALAVDPECALAHAYAAALFLTRLDREGQVQAAPRLHAAQAHAALATERERMIVAAVARWAVGDPAGAARLLAEIVARWPHDLVSAKLAQILQIETGDVAGMRRTAALAAAAESGSGHGTGLLAFALDQAGETDRAEALAHRALERDAAQDPWAQHALAHVYHARGDWAAGRAFLRAHGPGWERCSSFMLTHNWWHAALFALRLGDPGEALRLFDARVWGVRKGHAQGQINASALLARLELEGIDVGNRWEDVARHAAMHAGDGVSAFLDLHLLYALARAGWDEAAAETARRLMASGGEPAGALAEGVLAHARGDYRAAAVALGRARPGPVRIGGSQVQRHLFELLLVDCLARMRIGGGRAVHA